MTTNDSGRHCPVCGRFMRLSGKYANDHLDSWEESWKCSASHPALGGSGTNDK